MSRIGEIRGLIGKKNPEAIIIKTRFGIHTFGVRFPIDVIILNRTHTVVAIKEHLQPNCVYFWDPRFDTVVELPDGTARKRQIKLHDKITISGI